MSTHHASGRLDVALQAQSEDFARRQVLDPRYHGALEATARGQRLAAMTSAPGSAGYVAIERVTGTLDGRAGSFVLQHCGLMNRGTPELTVAVVPDSGSRALEGLAGRMAIHLEGGVHCHDFDHPLAD